MADMNKSLNQLVADLTVFYQKLRHYHWNVSGPKFFRLHEKFEEIYTEVGDAIDEVAERIVGLDGVPLHTLAHMLETSSISEDEKIPADNVMVTNIVADMKSIQKGFLKVIAEAEEADDRTTVNLMDELNDGFEAHLWMLKAWQVE